MLEASSLHPGVCVARKLLMVEFHIVQSIGDAVRIANAVNDMKLSNEKLARDADVRIGKLSSDTDLRIHTLFSEIRVSSERLSGDVKGSNGEMKGNIGEMKGTVLESKTEAGTQHCRGRIP